MRRTLAAAIVPCAPFFGACFPDYAISAGAGDAAVDSGATVADAGTPVLVGSTKGALTYPAPTTLMIPYQVHHAGDLLVLGTYIANVNVSVTNVSDTLGSTFQHAPPQAGGTITPCSGNEVNLQIFYASAASAGSDTISLVHDGSDAFGTFVLEYAGLTRGGMLDGTAATVATSTAMTMSAGTLTTSGRRDLVVALFADMASYGTMTAGSGFVAEEIDPGFASLIEDDMPAGAAPGMHDAQAVLPANDDAGLECWVGISAAFE